MDKKQFGISLNPKLHMAVKMMAAALNTSVSALTEKGLKMLLEQENFEYLLHIPKKTSASY